MLERITDFIAPAGSFVVALIVTAFGYGKMSQRVTTLEDYRSQNREEHRKIFDELKIIAEHIGDVKRYMKDHNGRND
jgi:hypothetical protein